jgi:hypothetical protein
VEQSDTARPAAVESAVDGPTKVIASPVATDFADEIVNVPLVPAAANAIVPKLAPLSSILNVVLAVAAVERVASDVHATPTAVTDPPAGIVCATGLRYFAITCDAV